MTARQVRQRVATGVLVTTLLSAGATLALNRHRPTLTFGKALDSTAVRSGSGATTFTPIRPTAPWFRETFILFREDGALPQNARVSTLVTAPAATAQLAAPGLQPPGVVQNLRRTDQH